MKLISIIVATYNSGKTLRRCIDSIIPQLGEDSELLIIDGNSKDDTMSIVKSYGDKIAYSVSEPDKGVYDAWNKGIKVAKGKWIAFVGSDDEMLPNTFNLYRAFLSENGSSFDLICGKIYFVNFEGKVIRKVGEPWDWHKLARRKLAFAHPGMLHNRELFNRIGKFDLQYRICADSDFLQRIGPNSKGGFINDYLIRMSEGGLSDGYAALREGFLTRKNNKCIPAYLNYYMHIRILIRYTIGKQLRNIKSYFQSV